MKLKFEEFSIDTRARQILRGGVEVHLSPKAFDLLAFLIDRRPEVVEKGELRDKLWPGVHVVEASLSNLVTEIRAAFVDSRATAPIVRTAHGIGYAFAGAMSRAVDAPQPRAGEDARHWLVWKDRPLPLVSGENIIGRDASCDVWIDAGGVSRRHARVHVARASNDAAVVVEDLKSTNGTYVQGRKVTEPVALTHGDRVRLGDATLVYRSRSADAATKRIRRPT
jgi:DNA-binding winged helix-turn-helix (wHTH) protein